MLQHVSSQNAVDAGTKAGTWQQNKADTAEIRMRLRWWTGSLYSMKSLCVGDALCQLLGSAPRSNMTHSQQTILAAATLVLHPTLTSKTPVVGTLISSNASLIFDALISLTSSSIPSSPAPILNAPLDRHARRLNAAGNCGRTPDEANWLLLVELLGEYNVGRTAVHDALGGKRVNNRDTNDRHRNVMTC
ncbi:unnamed protein product [Ectocarpus sp. 12 AP-2014]